MNQRDLEQLSAYLDGQLTPSDSARLEARLKTDHQLDSVLKDLRATRSLLRKLPARKAPRNFTLTRKMVGQNPPLPRTYPIFRFATALATLLFFFSFGLNTVGSQLASSAPAFGMGGSGGGDGNEESIQSFAAEAPAATEAPAMDEPAAAEMAPTFSPTEVADAARVQETPSSKAGDAANDSGLNQPPVENEAPSPVPLVSSVWQIGLAVVAILSILLMFVMRQISLSRWK